MVENRALTPDIAQNKYYPLRNSIFIWTNPREQNGSCGYCSALVARVNGLLIDTIYSLLAEKAVAPSLQYSWENPMDGGAW